MFHMKQPWLQILLLLMRQDRKGQCWCWWMWVSVDASCILTRGSWLGSIWLRSGVCTLSSLFALALWCLRWWLDCPSPERSGPAEHSSGPGQNVMSRHKRERNKGISLWLHSDLNWLYYDSINQKLILSVWYDQFNLFLFVFDLTHIWV